MAADASKHPILGRRRRCRSGAAAARSTRACSVDEKAEVLLRGAVQDFSAPVAWTRSYKGGRVVYTSLGHRDDFQQPSFQTFLLRAVHWAMKRPPPESVKE